MFGFECNLVKLCALANIFAGRGFALPTTNTDLLTESKNQRLISDKLTTVVIFGSEQKYYKKNSLFHPALEFTTEKEQKISLSICGVYV